MAGDAFEVVVGRSAVHHGGDTVIGTGLLLHIGFHEISAYASSEILVETRTGVELGIVTVHAGGGNNTGLMGVAQAEGIVSAAQILGYTD